MPEKCLLFEVSQGCNLKQFLFYFKDVDEQTLDGEQKAWALIRYLRGNSFDFHYKQLAEKRKLLGGKKSYENMKSILPNQFGRKWTLRKYSNMH